MRLNCTRLQAFSRIFPSRKGVLTHIEKNWSFVERGLNERKVRRNHNSIYRRAHKFLTVSERRMHCLAFYGLELALSFGVSFESNVLSSRALLTLFTYWHKQYTRVTSTFLSIRFFFRIICKSTMNTITNAVCTIVSRSRACLVKNMTFYIHDLSHIVTLDEITSHRSRSTSRPRRPRQFLNSNICARIPDNKNI